jgi:hypothetical protein
VQSRINLLLREIIQFKLDEFKRASLLEKAALVIIYILGLFFYVGTILAVAAPFYFSYKFLRLLAS